jgi:hypothetical protein
MPDRPAALPPEATRMYDAGVEAGRLSDGHNKLKQVRVQELLRFPVRERRSADALAGKVLSYLRRSRKD